MLSGISIAHAIKTKMGNEYHGVFPPHFGLGLAALLSCMLSSFVLLLLFSFVLFEFSMLVVVVDTALMFILISLLLRLIQGRAALNSIKLAQVYSVACIAVGIAWLMLTDSHLSPTLLTGLAWTGIAAGVVAAFLFSTKRFRQLVQYQQKVWRVRLEVLADVKSSAAR
jgi:tellurite resistance protein TehA-like permease